MRQELPNSNGQIHRAAADLRRQTIRSHVLDRAEHVILNPPAKPYRRSWIWAAGLATAACVGVFAMLPTESAASRLMQIAQNSDNLLHHLRQYEVAPDGSKKLYFEAYAVRDRVKGIFSTGQQFTLDGDQVANLQTDGAVTLDKADPKRQGYLRYSAKEIIASNVATAGFKVSVDKNVPWRGMKVDRYTMWGSFVDGQGKTLESRSIIYAEPRRQLPIAEEVHTTGFNENICEWDYPAYDPTLLSLPKVDPNRVYDHEAFRNAILTRLRKPGRIAKVGGQTVELVDLWTDEAGDAWAIVKAGYAYPYDYGIEVEGLDLHPVSKTPPFSGGYQIVQPSMFEGVKIQFIKAGRETLAPKVSFPDKVTLRIPVFQADHLLGYARFPNVQVRKTWALPYLLSPRNQPFWLDKSKESVP